MNVGSSVIELADNSGEVRRSAVNVRLSGYSGSDPSSGGSQPGCFSDIIQTSCRMASTLHCLAGAHCRPHRYDRATGIISRQRPEIWKTDISHAHYICHHITTSPGSLPTHRQLAPRCSDATVIQFTMTVHCRTLNVLTRGGRAPDPGSINIKVDTQKKADVSEKFL